MIDKVVVNGNIITVYITNKTPYTEEKIVRKIQLENLLETWKEHNKRLYKWCKQQGFLKVLPGWSGYHYAKVKRYGKILWCEIDILREPPEILRYLKRLDENYFLSHVIPENEWGNWVKNVKVTIRKQP